MKNLKQEIEIIKHPEGYLTIKVHDIVEGAPIMNYTWCLQHLTPETVEALKAELNKL